MSRKATAAVLKEAQGRFSLEEVVLDDLRSNEILVRIEAAGVCHTDVMAQELIDLPAVLGHEGTGMVEEVGASVTYVRPGDRVIMSYASCAECRHCYDGKPYICEKNLQLNFDCCRIDGSSTISLQGNPISSAFFQQSSFASHAIAVEHNVVRVMGNCSPEMLGAIPCGVLTGAGAVFNTFELGPKDNLVVFGVGAVGLSAIMAARVSGVFPLIAVDINQERLDLALDLGATHAFNAAEGDVPERIRDLVANGMRYSFETSGNEAALNDAIESLGLGGCCGMVTAPHMDQKYPFSPSNIMLRAASLKGIFTGSAIPRTFIPKILELNAQGRFPYEALITTYDFSDINKAFDDSRAGRTIKPVVLMS